LGWTPPASGCSARPGWQPRSLALIEEAIRAYPGQAALHLIVGLVKLRGDGRADQWACDRGVTWAFAFTPVRGTHLADRPPPPLAVYRRMQAARWLVVHGLTRFEEMAFDGQERWACLNRPVPATGEPFRTSGCPNCNRPFYNEQPSGPMYNYPRPLTAEEAARASRDGDQSYAE
jgi:biotin synthase